MQELENLWPSTLGRLRLPSLPVHILDKQAEYFNSMMQNILIAGIRSRETVLNNKPVIIHELRVSAPYLGSYSLTILRMVHDNVHLYPVQVYDTIRDQKSDNIDNDNELREVLRSILGSEELNAAISSLLAQVKFYSSRPETIEEDLPF